MKCMTSEGDGLTPRCEISGLLFHNPVQRQSTGQSRLSGLVTFTNIEMSTCLCEPAESPKSVGLRER